MMEINNLISILKSKQNEYLEEINITKNAIKKIKDAFNNNTVCDIETLNDAIQIIEKYEYEKFIESRYTKEELEAHYQNLVGKSLLIRFATKKSLKDINMNGKHFDDVDSYKELLNRLCELESYFSKINSGIKGKGVMLEREFSVKNNVLKAIIVSYYNNITNVLDMVYKRLININNKYDGLIDILCQLYSCDINNNTEEYKALVNDYSKHIRNNPAFDFSESKDLNIYFRNIVKDYDKKQKLNETEPLYKYGTREERFEQHEKNQIEENLNTLINQMNSESKMWLEIVVEQIKTSNDVTIMEYINNPMTCLPGEKEVDKDTFNLIVSAAIEDLRFTDKDKYKEMIDSLSAVKK